MSQQTEAKETWVDLEKKLLPYQRASVDKICEHFRSSGKALLADEAPEEEPVEEETPAEE